MLTRNITSKLRSNYLNLCRILVVSKRNMSSEQEDVIIESFNDKGVITLNRPKALNALNLSMVQKIIPVMKKWEVEKKLVIMKATGDKAFCAGGDVRAIAIAKKRGQKLGEEFFKNEYTLNGIIGTYGIPYVAFIDGIVMGGGVGLSVHGPYRVGTERTLFAMPETAIGLFPDVGGSYFLSRLPGSLGTFLGLTGYRLKGYDVFKAGVATHYVESNSLPDLQAELLKCSDENNIENTLKKFHKKLDVNFSLAPYLTQIAKCFSAPTLEEIVKRLKEDRSEWAKSTLQLLEKMSPTSMKVTLKEIQIGKDLDLQECLQMEYRLAVNTLAHKDFYEGVRALLIDKDQSPAWNPPTIEKVTNDLVNEFFAKLPDDQELKHKL